MTLVHKSPALACPAPDVLGDFGRICCLAGNGEWIDPAKFDLEAYFEIRDFLISAQRAAGRTRLHPRDDGVARLALVFQVFETVADAALPARTIEAQLGELISTFELLKPGSHLDRTTHGGPLIKLGSFLTQLEEVVEHWQSVTA